jgi:hypothetical protein
VLVKKAFRIALLGVGLAAAVTTVRRLMARGSAAEREQLERDLERFEGEGGTPANSP